MFKRRKYPSRKQIMEKLVYDPKTGTFLWKRRKHKRAGGYLGVYPTITLNGFDCPVSHLVWVMEMGRAPRGPIYCKNGRPQDTRFSNLLEGAEPLPKQPAPPAITIAEVKERYDYDAESGTLSHVKTGEPACVWYNGLPSIRIAKRYVYVRDIVWLLETGALPPRRLRHLNRVKYDNRFENLVLSPRSGKFTSDDVQAAERAKADLARLGIDATDIDAEALRLLG